MKLLNHALRGTKNANEARFARKEHQTFSYSPEMQETVADLLTDFVPLDPEKRIWNDGWRKTGPGLSFRKETLGWTAQLHSIKIQVMPDCDARDIHEWLTMFHSTIKSPAGQNIKLEEQEMTISLGVFKSEPSCVASEFRGEIAFHRLQGSSRLFAAGIEKATSAWEKPTTLQHIFLHELADFFIELHPELVDDLMTDLQEGTDYTTIVKETSPVYLMPIWETTRDNLKDIRRLRFFANEFIAEILACNGFSSPRESLPVPVQSLFSPFPVRYKPPGQFHY